jgi:hypothetical protein
MPQWTHHRARVAALSRDRAANDPDLLDARRDLRAARLEEYIARTVTAAPPLTGEQRSRLALLLRTTGAGDRDGEGLTGDRPLLTDKRCGQLAQQAVEGQL